MGETNRIHIVEVSIVAVTLLIMALFLYSFHPEFFAFSFSSYAFPSLLAAFGNATSLILALQLKTKTAAVQWYAAFTGCLLIWSGFEFLQRISVTSTAAAYWSTACALGYITVPAMFYLFACTYTKVDLIKRTWLILSLLAVTSFLLLLAFSTDLIVIRTPSLMIFRPWGYDGPYGPLFPLFLVWFLCLFVIPLIWLFQAYRGSSRPSTKRQILVLLLVVGVPFFGGALTDGILPVLHIEFYPIAMLLTSVMAPLVYLAFARNDLLVFSPAAISATILDTMQEGVVVTGVDSVVEYANIRALSMLGVQSDQAIGQTVSKLLGQSGGVLEKLLMDPHGKRNHKIKILNNKGTVIPVSATIGNLIDEGKNLVGHSIIFDDITALEASNEKLEIEKASVEKKVEDRTNQLHERTAQLLASINSLDLGYIMSSLDKEVVLINSSAEELLGVSKASRTISSIEDGAHYPIDLSGPISQCLTTNSSVDLKDVAYNTQFFHIHCSPIAVSNNTIGVVTLIQDISEAKILDRSKDEFFSIASHELRTPLTVIRGYSSLLEEKYVPQLADEQFTKYIGHIHNSTAQLIKIVNDFLDLSRLDQGSIKFSLTTFDVLEMAKEVAADFETLAHTKGLSVLVKPHKTLSALVLADQSRVRQVLVNLIGNALKFTESGGILVQISHTQGKLRVRVHDTGMGISTANQGLLFHKFQQASDDILVRNTPQGTGLGLYISKLLIEGMGGTIYLEASTPKEGTTFAFTLPLA